MLFTENADAKRGYTRETTGLRWRKPATAKQPNELAAFAVEGKRGETYSPRFAQPRVPQRSAGSEELIAIALL